ncbi:MAG: mechanosensitive ion channel, partial [Caldisericia bacterium]|nr:mechanosensitive ion channel [Caldisericia bacterium]
IDNTITPLIVQFVRYAIIVTAVISVLQIFGIGTASIIAVLGSFGLAIGLALQGAMSNVASGIMIIALRPFSVGNTVEIGGISGTVTQIGLFYTKLNTFDGVNVVMPNSKIWGTEIKNYSKNKIRRMNLKFGIGYGDDINKAYSIIDNIYKAESKILDDPAPTIAVTELADSSVNLIAYAWTKTGDWWDTQLKLVKTVKEAFDKEGISIPFPQTDVHLFSEKSE